MHHSPTPDPNAWRRNQQPSPNPHPHPYTRGPHRRRKIWLLSLFAVLATVLGFAGIGAIAESGQPKDAEPDPAVAGQAREDPVEEDPRPEDSGTETASPDGSPSEAATSTDEPPSAARLTVARIVDGDTIEVHGNGGILPKGAAVPVRLLEVDTPEVGTCYGDEATSHTSDLLPLGSNVRVERDKDLKDRYGRYLLYVWNDQGEFVNESLVSSGYAKAALYPPNDKYWPTISQAGDDAEQTGAGLWNACGETPRSTETPEPTDTPEPADTPEPGPSDEPSSPGLPAGDGDLDCSDLDGPTPVGPDDPHRLDRDGDGIGCNSN